MRYLALCCFSLLSLPVASYDFCVEDWACSQVIKQNGHTQFWLANNKAYPITMTLKVKTQNLRSSEQSRNNYSRTLVLAGHQKTNALSLFKQNPSHRSWYDYEFQWSPGDMHAQHDKSHRYQRPFPVNSKARLVQGFGGGFSHRGASRYALDFAMPVGSEILAARDGTVIDLTEHNTKGGADRRYAGYANFVTILHRDGTMGEYYHLKYNGVVVNIGDQVKAGQLIAYSGNTGFSSLPHLHFAVYKAKSHGGYQSLPFRFSD